MGMVAGIISMVSSGVSMGEQSKAGSQAREAGWAGAQSILEETVVNVAQTKKSQAQTLGLAKALTAASGVKFDARKIAAVKFSEGGLRTRTETEKEWEAGTIWNTDFTMEEHLFGGASFYEKETDVSITESLDYGEQIAGAEEGDSAFTYLREMKKAFAKDIGWQFKQGASRAKVARLGGTVAYAQSKAGVAQTAGSTSQTAYNWWKES